MLITISIFHIVPIFFVLVVNTSQGKDEVAKATESWENDKSHPYIDILELSQQEQAVEARRGGAKVIVIQYILSIYPIFY